MFSVEIDHEAQFIVWYTPHKGSQATKDYPGEPDTVEINSISLYGADLTNKQMDAFIKSFGLACLEEICLEDADNWVLNKDEYLAKPKGVA